MLGIVKLNINNIIYSTNNLKYINRQTRLLTKFEC